MKRLGNLVVLAVGVIILSGCAHGPRSPFPGEKSVFPVDAGGRPITALEMGSSLHVGAKGLRPNTTYELRLSFGPGPAHSLEKAVSFARSSTDRAGNIPPVVLWYQSGVVGCHAKEGTVLAPNTFRTFDDAERALHELRNLNLHPCRHRRGIGVGEVKRTGDHQTANR